MNTEKLKHIVGEVKKDEPAIIRFFDSINSESVDTFNSEFLWLQDFVKPSKIIVKINSEGGSVLYGMSSFSIIHSCPIETECIIEGVAASMGSILWAAGDNLYMHDYSLLMIHNPFQEDSDSQDESNSQVVKAFRHQIATIYQKRFNMTKDQIAAIMDGKDENDGTWFNAQEAVKAGIIDKDHVIKTSKVICEKVKNKIDGIEDITSIRNIMSDISVDVDENNHIKNVSTINSQGYNQTINQNTQMEVKESFNLDAISAQLGIPKEAQITAVTARIADLMKAEKDLVEIQSKFSELEIKFKGKEAEISNLNDELSQIKASLQKYIDAEKQAFDNKVISMIDNAISAGKIMAETKESWIKMAKSDFETVKATLDSIPQRKVITDAIANEPSNVHAVEKTLEDVEAKMQEDVKKVVGDFNLKTF